MKLTSRALRRLKLIYGNIAKTLNPARLYRVVSGRVQRWVRFYRPSADLFHPISKALLFCHKSSSKLLYIGKKNRSPKTRKIQRLEEGMDLALNGKGHKELLAAMRELCPDAKISTTQLQEEINGIKQRLSTLEASRALK